MEDTPRAGPSVPRKRHHLSPSPDRAQKRPRAAIMPISLKGDQIIRPLTRVNQHIQIATLQICEHDQYYLIRTGALVLDPAKTQALNMDDPVPIMLPNEVPISNTATILTIELVPPILPNVEDHHYQMLLDLEQEENRVISMRQTVRELERQSPNSRVIRAWSNALHVMNPSLGYKLHQAVEYERNAAAFIPGYQYPHTPPPKPPHSLSSLYRRRLRAIRQRLNDLPYQGPLDLPLPVFLEPLEICRKFLDGLISTAEGRPPRLERATQLLVQFLVDNVMGPELFCQRLELLLEAHAQPYLVRFLTENMCRLRQSLYMKHSFLNGINSPSHRVAFPIPEPQLELLDSMMLSGPGPGCSSTPGPGCSSTPGLPQRASPPIAAVAPLQPIPLSHIPYYLPVPMSPIHLWQVTRAGLPALTKTVPKEGDLHLYNPRVGYVHLPSIPDVKSFQLGETTVRVPSQRPKTRQCLYRY